MEPDVMPLLGPAAMLLSFDVVSEAIAEHDDWHTQEHLPERLSIPGFLRATRWVALRGPRYLVLYEVEQLATLTSEAYLERLNNPTAWTAKMMPYYRNMSRGFCSVTGSFGFGVGHAALLIRFQAAADAAASLRRWLTREVLPRLPSNPGIGSAHLLEAALTPAMTSEQRLRGGADAGVGWALFVTGYRQEALSDLLQDELRGADMEQRGATGVVDAMYRIDYSLAHDEAAAS